MDNSQKTLLDSWNLKRCLEKIESVEPIPNTSVISILLKPDDQIIRVRNMLSEKLQGAANIKSNSNKLSVQDGLKTISEYLKPYRQIPKNGLACYFASQVWDPVQEKAVKLKLFFEPPKPIESFVYNCGPSFETAALRKLLQDETPVGYIIIDGKEYLFATVQGNSKKILFKCNVHLPRKHSKGGQSAARFSRFREDSRKNYIAAVCEKASEVFITENVANVAHIIIAGQADLKYYLENYSQWDVRLKPLIGQPITIVYGGEFGLQQAITQSHQTVKNLRLNQEIQILDCFFKKLNRGEDSLLAYGVKNVMDALEEGAVDMLIAWQDLTLVRWEIKEKDSSVRVEYLKNDQKSSFSNTDCESTPLVDWLLEKAPARGFRLELVSDQSVEGNMLVQSFDGIVAVLRYPKSQEEEYYNPLDADDETLDEYFQNSDEEE